MSPPDSEGRAPRKGAAAITAVNRPVDTAESSEAIDGSRLRERERHVDLGLTDDGDAIGGDR